MHYHSSMSSMLRQCVRHTIRECGHMTREADSTRIVSCMTCRLKAQGAVLEEGRALVTMVRRRVISPPPHLGGAATVSHDGRTLYVVDSGAVGSRNLKAKNVKGKVSNPGSMSCLNITTPFGNSKPEHLPSCSQLEVLKLAVHAE